MHTCFAKQHSDGCIAHVHISLRNTHLPEKDLFLLVSGHRSAGGIRLTAVKSTTRFSCAETSATKCPIRALCQRNGPDP